MEVKYKFVPEYESREIKYKSDVTSYAGKLLELVNACTLIVGIDNHNEPFVYSLDSRMIDALDVDLIEY